MLRAVILVDAHDLGASRPGRPLFSEVSVTVSSGDRLGIVGINGAGKSTLLRALAGGAETELHAGTIRRGRDTTVAMLDQQAAPPPGPVSAAIGDSWQAMALLDRLGIGGALANADVGTLSVGQARRVALASVLAAQADLLVLDEPTNHLDLETTEWLEAELDRFKGGLVLVTHDRLLLHRLADRILELDNGVAYHHDGGYGAYLQARAAREAGAVAAERARRSLARQELAWLRRGAPARTRKSKARVRSATETVNARRARPVRGSSLDLDSVSGSFGPGGAADASTPGGAGPKRWGADSARAASAPRLGTQVIELHDVTLGYPDASALVSGLDLILDRRERLGVVGPNGAGKSTLLDVMAGRRDAMEGRVVIGPTVHLGYYDQRHRDLDPTLAVYETLCGPGGKLEGPQAALLERFWFDADTQRAPVGLLSGGERRRLQLVATLAARPNVLLLDEPTNDLDLDTLRALEDFLDGWPGAVVAASHDRAFLERVAHDVIVLDGDGRAVRWPGGLEQWVEHRRNRQGSGSAGTRRVAASPQARRGSQSAAHEKSPGAGAGRVGPKRRRTPSTVRHQLSRAERELDEATRSEQRRQARFDAAPGDDHEALAALGHELAEAVARRSEAEQRWLELSVELEELSKPH